MSSEKFEEQIFRQTNINMTLPLFNFISVSFPQQKMWKSCLFNCNVNIGVDIHAWRLVSWLIGFVRKTTDTISIHEDIHIDSYI